MTAQGTNHLFQTGAKLAMSSDDILIDLHPQLRVSIADQRHCDEAVRPMKQSKSEIACNDSLEAIDDSLNHSLLKLLSNKPLSLDEIIVSLDILPNDVMNRLTQLEVRGAVKRMLGGKYARTQGAAIT